MPNKGKDRKVEIYCINRSECCAVCWGLEVTKKIKDKYSVNAKRVIIKKYQEREADIIRKTFNIEGSPVAIFFKSGAIVHRMVGKFINGEVINKLKSLNWV